MTKEEIQAILEAQKSTPDIGTGFSEKDLEAMSQPAADLGNIQKQLNTIRKLAPEQGLDPESEVFRHLDDLRRQNKLSVDDFRSLLSAKTLDQQYGMGRALLQTPTLGAADEIEALMKSTFGDRTYDENLAQINLARKMFEKQNPRAETAAEVTSTVASLPMFAKGVSSIIDKFPKPKNIGAGTKLASYILGGAAVGGTEGGLRELPGKRATGARTGALITGGLGVGGELAGKVASKTPLPDFLSKQYDKLFGTDKSDAIQRLAELEVLGAIKRDKKDISEINPLLQEFRGDDFLTRGAGTYSPKPVILADVIGPETESLAALTARYPGSIKTTQDILDIREGGQSSRLMGDFKEALDVNQSAFDLKEQHLNNVEEVARKQYDKLMTNDEYIYNDTIREIVMRPGFKNIYDKYRQNKVEFGKRSEIPPTFEEILKDPESGISLAGINFFKKGLDKQIQTLKKSRNRSPADDDRLIELQGIRREFMSEVDRVAPPEYKAARQIYIDRYEAEDAINLARKTMLKRDTSAQEFEKLYKNLRNDAERDAFKVGMYDLVREKIQTARMNKDDGTNVLGDLYRNEQIRDKYESVLGKDSYEKLIKKLDQELQMKNVDIALTSGSVTQPKLAQEEFFKDQKRVEVTQDPKTNLLRGILSYVIKSTDPTPDKANRVASMLLELNPTRQQEILANLSKLDQTIYNEILRRMGINVAGAASGSRVITQE